MCWYMTLRKFKRIRALHSFTLSIKIHYTVLDKILKSAIILMHGIQW